MHFIIRSSRIMTIRSPLWWWPRPPENVLLQTFGRQKRAPNTKKTDLISHLRACTLVEGVFVGLSTKSMTRIRTRGRWYCVLTPSAACILSLTMPVYLVLCYLYNSERDTCTAFTFLYTYNILDSEQNSGS